MCKRRIFAVKLNIDLALNVPIKSYEISLFIDRYYARSAKSHQTRHQKNAEIYDQHIRLRFQKYRKSVKGVRKWKKSVIRCKAVWGKWEKTKWRLRLYTLFMTTIKYSAHKSYFHKQEFSDNNKK